MTVRDFSDQTKIFDPDLLTEPVHVIGAGGIGNMVVMLLAKMGVKEIHIWDDDKLEEHNGPTEIAYSERFIGEYKTEAAAETVKFLLPYKNEVSVYQHQERVTAETELWGVVISGVDSMAARKEIYQAIENNLHQVSLYIDARSAGQNVLILSFEPIDSEADEAYRTSWLYSDEEAMKLECGARNVGYISAYIAAEIGNTVARFSRCEKIQFIITRDFSDIDE